MFYKLFKKNCQYDTVKSFATFVELQRFVNQNEILHPSYHSLPNVIPFKRGCPDQVFFYPDTDRSPLIFSICRYWVRYLVLTNIFLDNTAALRKKVPASKLFLNRFSPLLKQSLYFHMALSYSAYAIATLAYHLPCVSRWVCDAALWQQTLVCSQLKCVRRSSHLVPPYHVLLFTNSLRCHVK